MDNNENNNKRKLSCLEITLYIYLLGVVVFVLLKPIPNFKRHTYNRDKICFSNIRVLQGAVEMYNMDVKKDEEMSNLDIDILINGKYLKEIPKKPEESCQYVGSDLNKSGSVFCTYHGDIEGKTQGSRTKSMTYKFNFNENLEQLPYALGWPIVVPFIAFMIVTSR